MESVGLKKEETVYRTKWKDVIEIWKVWLKEGGNSVQDKVKQRKEWKDVIEIWKVWA